MKQKKEAMKWKVDERMQIFISCELNARLHLKEMKNQSSIVNNIKKICR
jgi:hypothetical protein